MGLPDDSVDVETPVEKPNVVTNEEPAEGAVPVADAK